MTSDKVQVKRKHHYVWAYHLKQWSLDGTNIYYTTKKGKIAKGSIKGLATEKDFYKVNFLNKEDVYFIRIFSSLSPSELRKEHDAYLSDFYRMARAADLAKDEKLAVPRLEEFQHNVLENLHGAHENDVIDILKKLNKGDLSVFELSENRVKFKQFLGVQVTRTKSFRDVTLTTTVNREAYKKYRNPPFDFEKYRYLMKKNWWFLSYLFGINIGTSLISTGNQDKQILLENNTSEPFITSDTPVINVHESVNNRSKNEPPEFVDVYYPLSPKYAYMINNSDRYPAGKVSITEQEAVRFNIEMALRADEHIFAQTEGQIKNIKKLVKKARKN